MKSFWEVIQEIQQQSGENSFLRNLNFEMKLKFQNVINREKFVYEDS